MTVEVGGAGLLGIAFETTLGEYVAPTKWIPIRSESLNLVEDKIYRMNLRGTADRTGAIKGYFHVEGDIEFEVSADILVYFMYASRVLPSKGAPDYGSGNLYEFTPVHVAKTSTDSGTDKRKTLSIYVQRSQIPFAYLGCSVSQMAWSYDAGVAVVTASIIGVGLDLDQTEETPSYDSQIVMGPGKVTLTMDDTDVQTEADTFGFTINDNAVAQNRLNGKRSAAYVNWGEREVSANMEYDFEDLEKYNDFIEQTFHKFSLDMDGGAEGDDNITVDINAAVNEADTVDLSGLGDVVKGSVTFHGIYNEADAYKVSIQTAENIT